MITIASYEISDEDLQFKVFVALVIPSVFSQEKECVHDYLVMMKWRQDDIIIV